MHGTMSGTDRECRTCRHTVTMKSRLVVTIQFRFPKSINGCATFGDVSHPFVNGKQEGRQCLLYAD
jgi:hypothetical protein